LGGGGEETSYILNVPRLLSWGRNLTPPALTSAPSTGCSLLLSYGWTSTAVIFSFTLIINLSIGFHYLWKLASLFISLGMCVVSTGSVSNDLWTRYFAGSKRPGQARLASPYMCLICLLSLQG
jgi:hypothetical protein